MGFIKIWKNIIVNPFEGFSGVTDETKWFLPLIAILILVFLSTVLFVPIMQSDEYTGALMRATVNQQAEKGVDMSLEQQKAMSEQLSSPLIKKITIASALGGGIITFVIIMLLTALFIKLLAAILKNKVKFLLIFKVLIFISIITIVQSLIKSGITLSGDWARILNKVNDMTGLKLALSAPVSLAAIFSVNVIGSKGDSYFSCSVYTYWICI